MSMDAEIPVFDSTLKKKKKKPAQKAEVVEQKEEEEVHDEHVEVHETVPTEGQVGYNYSYEELANRIYALLHHSNPNFESKPARYKMPPPMLIRIGSKRTGWTNFQETCQALHRKPEHFKTYVLTELGVDGSIDGSYHLVMKGRFSPKQIENVIRHYVIEYVACKICKSPETQLKKENRLYFVSCQACGSSRSVSAIKSGFEAQIGKRKNNV
eukprot:Phypoly_transcript_17742.p1 GENE.Phypoly_transcript_17742~~Phypoly_transcript_17742.p1  ORF type:complete len:212 (+),score=39.34 Phypoly_transcript_17742:55-690(+)